MNSNTYKLTLTGLNEKAAVFAVTNSMGRCVGSVTAEAKEWRRVAECWGGEVDISRAEPAQAQAPAGETRLSHPLVHAAFDKLRRRGQRQRRPEREGITLRFRGISVTAELPAKILASGRRPEGEGNVTEVRDASAGPRGHRFDPRVTGGSASDFPEGSEAGSGVSSASRRSAALTNVSFNARRHSKVCVPF